MKKAVRIFGVLFIAALFGASPGVADHYSPDAVSLAIFSGGANAVRSCATPPPTPLPAVRGVGGGVSRSVNLQHPEPQPDSGKKVCSASVTTHPFCRHPSSEHSLKSFNNTHSSFKNPFSGFGAVLKLAGQLFESRYAQYVAGSKNFLIRFRKADIVFPFHYFW